MFRKKNQQHLLASIVQIGLVTVLVVFTLGYGVYPLTSPLVYLSHCDTQCLLYRNERSILRNSIIFTKHKRISIRKLISLSIFRVPDDDDDSLIENRNNNDQLESGNFNPILSRRNIIIAGGAFVTYQYGKLVYNAINDIQYPELHEKRIEDIMNIAFMNSAATIMKSSTKKPFRILEVGIGTKCRLIRRQLYNNAIQNLASKYGVSSIELVGLDFRLPNNDIMVDSRNTLDNLQNEIENDFSIDLQIVNDSITSSNLPWNDGYFDSIICCLTLCSVEDVNLAIQQMKRLIRPDGGTLGYVEHVAVNDDEASSHRFLQIQQQALDPLQQLLVDNCHLHRYTEQALVDNFMPSLLNSDISKGETPTAQILQQERFFVGAMGAVACQCCGVIQKTIA